MSGAGSQESLTVGGGCQSKYNGHSFTTSVATTAAANGLEDPIIKTTREVEELGKFTLN